MPRWIFLVLACLPGTAPAQTVAVPSGRAVETLDVITDAPGLGVTYRFRFVAPGLADVSDPGELALDLQYLCERVALPGLDDLGGVPDEIVITLLAEPIPFGETRPDVVQYFELYEPDGSACRWKAF